ncbi:MBL fold metallo-hydrolase [Lactococcus nasutitermitis]|uniref:MBL fold metallo-hydrolase n=1 Tax=Lactococcus nasutitermitis TaxID=1652957 RepID=A0ABV9JH05_9LACT|nr:MBL fold metallo-hydrolase [Lactococcus nasutitermitis]
MKIAENVEMLEVKIPRGDNFSIIYPTLTWDNSHLVLFDTGFPHTASFIVDEITKAGFDISNVTDIILTHQDVDHIGGCRELLALAPQAKVYAHEVDAAFIDGRKVPTKLDKLEQKKRDGSFTDNDLPFYTMLKDGFAVAQLPVNKTLKDGEVLDFCGGIETIFTPGHTPGHASFYLQESQMMICGDAANISADGKTLQGSNPAMTWDSELADTSLDKILTYDLNGAISYHTGFLKF